MAPHITISCYDTPNFEGISEADLRGMGRDDPRLDENPWPQLLNRRWVWEILHTKGPDDDEYRTRCLGQFPKESQYQLIRTICWKRA